MARRRNKALEREIARGRVEGLLRLAEDAALAGRLDDATRYVGLAWRITTRYVLEPPSALKARRCRACGDYLLAGTTSRTRVTGGKLSTTCLGCGHTRRIPFTRERRARRAAVPRAPAVGRAASAPPGAT